MGNLRAVPVLMQVPEGKCYTCKRMFTVSFYLPNSGFSSSVPPPEPLDPLVYIDKWNEKEVYVR